jgi:hypothetical protein
MKILQFAQFCFENGYIPTNLYKLCKLQQRAIRRWEKTQDLQKCEKVRDDFERFAAEFDFTVEWNSFVPTVKRNGVTVILPQV